ncbi:MAG: alpha/beta hydrolase [Eubacteriales bacterium]|nr:alpha/beta hydrolase [Eubacteriales bacterium]
MEIEVKAYTYETMPDYEDNVDGAKELPATGKEINVLYLPNIVYDCKDGQELRLQILQPSVFSEPDRQFPCVVFVQGSAWMPQNIYMNVANLGKLAAKGYVCAIVEYRHSGIAHFPAQIIDAKNAIRFLKKNCSQYQIDPEQVIIMGDSSGGHTSVLAGMTANTALLDEPSYPESCQVKGIVDLYGAVEVTLPYGYPTTENHQMADSPEGMLMGYEIRGREGEASIANALSYVGETFAPMLILHGTKDKTVFCEQSVRLYRALKEQGKDVELYLVRGADHGGAAFWSEEAVELYHRFIQRCMEKE